MPATTGSVSKRSSRRSGGWISWSTTPGVRSDQLLVRMKPEEWNLRHPHQLIGDVLIVRGPRRVTMLTPALGSHHRHHLSGRHHGKRGQTNYAAIEGGPHRFYQAPSRQGTRRRVALRSMPWPQASLKRIRRANAIGHATASAVCNTSHSGALARQTMWQPVCSFWPRTRPGTSPGR